MNYVIIAVIFDYMTYILNENPKFLYEVCVVDFDFEKNIFSKGEDI